jgi:hypothetical protein
MAEATTLPRDPNDLLHHLINTNGSLSTAVCAHGNITDYITDILRIIGLGKFCVAGSRESRVLADTVCGVNSYDPTPVCVFIGRAEWARGNKLVTCG